MKKITDPFKILVTGGLGFVFSHVVERLSEDGHDVTVIDKLGDGSHSELIDGFRQKGILVLAHDCVDVGKIFFPNDFDIIIHGAAESNVDKSIDNPAFFIKNVEATVATLEFARTCKNLKSFIYVNTDEVHGATEHYSDGRGIMPMNAYAASKASAGDFVRAYGNTYKLPVQEVRMCNVVGERQADTKILPRIISRMDAGEPFPMFDDGFATREYIDVHDVAECYAYLISNHEDFRNKTLEREERILKDRLHLITWNQELSIREMISLVGELAGKPIKTVPSTRLGHDNHYRMTPTLLPQLALSSHRTPIQRTIQRMLGM